MTNEERDKIIDKYKKDEEILNELGNKPHYVYVSAVLLDGKIWEWYIGVEERTLLEVDMNVPEELRFSPYDDKETYRRKQDEYYRRFSILNYPIWVDSLEEHNKAFEKGIKIYRNFPIHKDYCMGVKPYEE